MASKWYPLGVEAMLEAEGDWSDAGIKMALTTTTYNAAHDYYADVSASTVDTPKALANPVLTVAGSVLKYDADDTGLTWAALAAGSTITGVIVYLDTGNAATSPLLTFNDCTDTATNGGDITIEINASGIGTIDFT